MRTPKVSARTSSDEDDEWLRLARGATIGGGEESMTRYERWCVVRWVMFGGCSLVALFVAFYRVLMENLSPLRISQIRWRWSKAKLWSRPCEKCGELTNDAVSCTLSSPDGVMCPRCTLRRCPSMRMEAKRCGGYWARLAKAVECCREMR